MNSKYYNNADSNVFLVLFFSVFVGAVCVAFNTRILGGYISFLQCVAVLGYCVFPLFLAVVLLAILKFFQIHNRILRLLVVAATVVWSIFGKYRFIQLLEAS
ncbi:UNVERIFIED_CONTAM: hypothetical protein GTU68_065850 [Idotea baltica]|nr:hypothetical protein [Idotea baltica]